jgi:hypothetical protein
VITHVKRRSLAHVGELLLANGVVLGVTPNHPVHVSGPSRWVAAGRLRVGDRLVLARGAGVRPVRVLQVSYGQRRAEVFDIRVRRYRSYFAAGVLVHNY